MFHRDQYLLSSVNEQLLVLFYDGEKRDYEWDSIMDTITLKKLLRKHEGANLEFKRQWYELENPKKAEAAKGEMVKDILSLANGNTNVAGEASYLVIGASNEIDEQGNRELFDVESAKPITRQRILDIVNAYCDPSIEDLLCEEILIDGKKLLVITVLPSPHVHETIQKLKTSKVTYDEYTVFIRHAEGVRTASTKERVTLQEIKKLRFYDTINVSPTRFGALMGAFFMGLLGPKLVPPKEGQNLMAVGIAGASVGGLLGGLIGSNYSEIKKIPLAWKQATPKDNVIRLMAAAAYGLGSWWLIRFWDRRRKKNKTQKL